MDRVFQPGFGAFGVTSNEMLFETGPLMTPRKNRVPERVYSASTKSAVTGNELSQSSHCTAPEDLDGD